MLLEKGEIFCKSSSTETVETIDATRKTRDKSILPLWELSSTEQEILQRLSQCLHEKVETNSSIESRTTSENELSFLCKRLSETRTSN